MATVPDAEKFARLGRPRRIWAVAAIHGELRRLIALHDHIYQDFHPGDRLVYLGNMLGHGGQVVETVDEILAFRRVLLARPGMLASDIVFLRGAQEEMWHKLLQLQFAPNPAEVLRWMLQQGVTTTLESYGGRPAEGLAAARDGAVQLTRWTNRLREAIRTAPGHTQFYTALRRAAFTADDSMLLVSAGLDPNRPLAAQGDSFWWGATGFAGLDAPFERFRRMIRGHDPAGGGLCITEYTATLDGGAGRGGTLIGGLFAADGQVLDLVEA